jgi:hypothetical protein
LALLKIRRLGVLSLWSAGTSQRRKNKRLWNNWRRRDIMMRMMKTINVKTKNPSLIAMVIQKSKSIKMTTRAVRKSWSLQIKRKMRQRIS